MVWGLGWYEVSCHGQGVGLEDLQGPFQPYDGSVTRHLLCGWDPVHQGKHKDFRTTRTHELYCFSSNGSLLGTMECCYGRNFLPWEDEELKSPIFSQPLRFKLDIERNCILPEINFFRDICLNKQTWTISLFFSFSHVSQSKAQLNARYRGEEKHIAWQTDAFSPLEGALPKYTVNELL